MAELKAVLIEQQNGSFDALKDALLKENFDVTLCSGGFDALDELGTQGADILVASSSLPDLSGYQLSCLIKSNDRAGKLVVVLVKDQSSELDEFWKTASLPDLIVQQNDLENVEDLVARIKELVNNAKAQGWKPGMVKNLLLPTRMFSSEDVVDSYAALLDGLLIERLVTQLVRNMTGLMEPRQRFADAFFSSINHLFSPDLLAIVVASPENPWAAFQLAPGLNKDAFDQLVIKISKELQVMREVTLDIRGDLDESNQSKGLGEFEVLPIQARRAALLHWFSLPIRKRPSM
jgi:DNA-binding response OmpR family regulator